MPFGKDEAVPFRRLGIGNAKDVRVERGQDVRDGKSGTDVPDVRPLGLMEDDLANPARFDSAFTHALFRWVSS